MFAVVLNRSSLCKMEGEIVKRFIRFMKMVAKARILLVKRLNHEKLN